MKRTSYIFIIIVVIVIMVVFTSIFYLINDLLSRKRFFKIIEPFILSIDNKEPILDFGSSNPVIQEYFKDKNIISLDIDGPHVPNNVVKYDGHKIPYPDNYFDTTLVMFVLHHIPHQQDILKEIKRVTKNHIIVVEDIIDESPNNKVANIITKLHYLYFKQPTEHIEYQHNQEEWLGIFEKHQLQLIKNIYIEPHIIYPVSHRLFYLKV